MIAELGQYSMILALVTALILSIVPLIGAQANRYQLIAIARPAAWALFLWVAIAFICLTINFVQNDFSVLYVAQNSNSNLPLIYRICAVWGGHEGSILLWALMLAAWTLAVAIFSKHLPDKMIARILAILGILSVGVLLFTLLTSNPFDRMFPAAEDGRDLNPLLLDGVVLSLDDALMRGNHLLSRRSDAGVLENHRVARGEIVRKHDFLRHSRNIDGSNGSRKCFFRGREKFFRRWPVDTACGV